MIYLLEKRIEKNRIEESYDSVVRCRNDVVTSRYDVKRLIVRLLKNLYFTRVFTIRKLLQKY